MVEWRHHAATDHFDMLTGGGIALVKDIADQTDGDELATKGAGLVDFLLRCGNRHEHHALNAEMAAGKSKALRVVTRRSANEYLVVPRVIILHGLTQKVERASNLIGANRRQVFALEPNSGAVAIAKIFIQLQRRFRK